MNDANIRDIPEIYPRLLERCEEIGFTMPSDLYIGTLLKTLISAKPGGRFLELGTGIGLSLSWMLDGMDEQSHLTTIDNDPQLAEIAREFFGEVPQLEILCLDGGAWIRDYEGEGFDLIFADAWPGKYFDLEETLDLIRPGGFYVIDDMLPEPNWPEGHAEKADHLISFLENRPDLRLTKMNWSTGVIVAVRTEV
ncbi:O-methyltransferase [Flavilitoribacter nigricans]|uniref:SAM-dependent methyltransferase n=1 Tax=Flavilitoribacter nigricans (strain ATCC 23147 / DSM 23189 / NBRC 102662 / NCIMB 1420 / SS-2) TaxID=1122177 RepID=A0A2D0N540_FLAN2|nr:class I SAM-dependent methyltransferase [Flavilitoribacter nigricans]PHN03500.1 SAM-dependent methyltransferase [Flavilitoribacter nigricans DSM 23189 = NBRC 102662]